MEQLVISARNGDRKALSRLLETIREHVFQLSLRMLGYPSDAEDATQEILIKVMTHLAGFEQKSSFKTWVYKIGIHHLLNIKRKKMDKLNVSFQSWEDIIYKSHGDVRISDWNDQEQSLLLNETRTGCLQGLLICLDKNIRAAFILGEIFEFSSSEGALILEITPEAFRKRLSRGRRKIKEFMVNNCGFFRSDNPCSCSRQVERDIHLKIINPERLDYNDPKTENLSSSDITNALKELDDMGKLITLYKTYPRYSSPESVSNTIKELIQSKDYRLFQ